MAHVNSHQPPYFRLWELLIYQLVHIGRCITHGASEPSSESEAPDSDVATGQDADTTSPSGASELPVVEEKRHMHIHPQLLKVGAVIVSSGRYIKVRIAQSAVEAILEKL